MYELCDRCRRNPAAELHPCPYKSEINLDDEQCNCCPSCEEQCNVEI